MANDFKYRADVVGKMVPPETVEGTPTAEQLEAWTKRAFQAQTSAAFMVVSDGEFRRHNLAKGIAERGASGAPPRLVADEAAFGLATLGKRAALKVSLPAPSDVVRQLGEAAAKNGTPFDAASVGAAAIKGVRAEIKSLLEAGVLYVQLNTSGYDRWLGPNAPAKALTEVRSAVMLDTEAVAGLDRPANARIGFRFGRTGQNPLWSVDGADEQAKLEALFSIPVDRLLIDFGLQPADFSALRAVPADTHVVLGLIDNTGKLKQGPEALMKQIDLAAKERDGGLLSLSPRGGFNAATGVTWMQQKDALEITTDTATRWWGFAM